MSVSAASLNINEPLVDFNPQVEQVTSFLDKVVRFIAGKDVTDAIKPSLSDEAKAQLHSFTENPEEVLQKKLRDCN